MSLRGVSLLSIGLIGTISPLVLADPCGMVPPAYVDSADAIARMGVQQTYVFYKNGLETFVIRPGFRGKVEEFGMLVPFPTPPAIRKAPDDVFEQIAAAVDPPEVRIDLWQGWGGGGGGGGGFGSGLGGSLPGGARGFSLRPDEVQVVREEAIGMYEVAVLAAGSADALKKWMDDHGYRFPGGMERVCQEYVRDGWCFVAVRTKVAGKKSVDPLPGQRNVKAELPSGAEFDGYMQAMAFRFFSPRLEVPMRLSTFNGGETRNIVFVLADQPLAIRGIPNRYVKRQISGEALYRKLTDPLMVRILGFSGARHGTIFTGELPAKVLAKLPAADRARLPRDRDPTPKNGVARDLFGSDLVAALSRRLEHSHEGREKSLARINELLNLRGLEIGKLAQRETAAASKAAAAAGLKQLRGMTLSVIDGDFSREVLAKRNLVFYKFEIAASRNHPQRYNARLQGPETAAVLNLETPVAAVFPTQERVEYRDSTPRRFWWPAALAMAGIGFVVATWRYCRPAVPSRKRTDQKCRPTGFNSAVSDDGPTC